MGLEERCRLDSKFSSGSLLRSPSLLAKRLLARASRTSISRRICWALAIVLFTRQLRSQISNIQALLAACRRQQHLTRCCLAAPRT